MCAPGDMDIMWSGIALGGPVLGPAFLVDEPPPHAVRSAVAVLGTIDHVGLVVKNRSMGSVVGYGYPDFAR